MKEIDFSMVHDGIAVAALGCNAKFTSNNSVTLRSLNSSQLCQLFDHCYLYNLSDFVLRNSLIGIHLEDGIDSIQDLTELGMDKLTAKVLLKRIAVWKEEGLPEDFHPIFPSDTSGKVAVAGIADKKLDDDFIAARWCRDRAATDRIVEAAGAENHLAQAYLSILFDRDGTLLKKDRAEAEELAVKALPWLKENATKGCVFALYNLAMCYFDGRGLGKDEKDAAKYFKLAADRGHTQAVFMLGLCYDNGTGVTKDEREAVRYYRLAADQGDAVAQCSLGVCFENGAGVTRDKKEAVKYYMLAADQGQPTAQYNLGLCYEIGTFVPVDKTEAFKYYKLAAEQKDTDAQFVLGMCYQNGTGVAKDETEAAKFYKLAADQGHADAQYYLGMCYANGIGVPVNKIEAVKYYALAAEQGQAQATLALSRVT